MTGKQNQITNIEQTSTPRLREYFPETLVWNPELITDKNGKAELKFKMADNITNVETLHDRFDQKRENRHCRKRSSGISAVFR